MLFLRASDQIAAIINYFIVLIYIIFACISNVLYLKRRDMLVKEAYEKEMISKRGGAGGNQHNNAVMGTGIDDRPRRLRNNRRKHQQQSSRRGVSTGFSTLSTTGAGGGGGATSTGREDAGTAPLRRHQSRSVSGYQQHPSSITARQQSAGTTTTVTMPPMGSFPSNNRFPASTPNFAAGSLPPRHNNEKNKGSTDFPTRGSSGGGGGGSGIRSRGHSFGNAPLPPALPPGSSSINTANTAVSVSTVGSAPLYLAPSSSLGGDRKKEDSSHLLKTVQYYNQQHQQQSVVNNCSFTDDMMVSPGGRDSQSRATGGGGGGGDSQSRLSDDDESKGEVSQRNLHRLRNQKKQKRKHRGDKKKGDGSGRNSLLLDARSREDGGGDSSCMHDDDDGTSSYQSSNYNSDYRGGGHRIHSGGNESGLDDGASDARSSRNHFHSRASMVSVQGVDPLYAVNSQLFFKDRICRFFIFVVVFLLSRAVSTLGQLLAMFDLPLRQADAYFAVSSWMYYCLPLVLLHIFSTVLERYDPSPVLRLMRYGVIAMFWIMSITFFIAVILVNYVEDTIDQYWGVVVNIIYVIWYAFAGHYIPKRLRLHGTGLTAIATRIRNTSILFSVTFFLRIVFDLPALQNYYINQVGNFWIITIYLPFDLVPTGLTLLFLHSRDSSSSASGGGGEDSSNNNTDNNNNTNTQGNMTNSNLASSPLINSSSRTNEEVNEDHI